MIVLNTFLVGLLGWTLASPFSENNDLNNETFTSSELSSDTNVPSNLEIYIVGGMEAVPNEFPWLVNLRIDGAFCGGSLIAMDIVLTAAHCLFDSGKHIPSSKISVVAGDHNRRITEGKEQTQTAVETKVHENYDEELFKHDIGLIRLKNNFTRTRYVSPIGLKSVGNGSATSGTVAGWGSFAYGGKVSDILYKVDVPIVRDSTCGRQLSNPNGQFCAGGNGKDSCQGDSGGPFICKNSPNVICGIVSYGEGCALEGKPGVYSNVSAYTQWIDQSLLPNAKGWVSSSITVLSSWTLIVMSILLSSFSSCCFGRIIIACDQDGRT